jgi:hypothetical protein
MKAEPPDLGAPHVEDIEMKTIYSLISACFCTLAFASPALPQELATGARTMADRVSWSEMVSQGWFGPSREHRPVKVIEINLDPSTANVPGAIAAVLPEYEAVLGSVRAAVARDQLLSSSLKSKGYGLNDVLGLSRNENGAVSLFVSSAT